MISRGKFYKLCTVVYDSVSFLELCKIYSPCYIICVMRDSIHVYNIYDIELKEQVIHCPRLLVLIYMLSKCQYIEFYSLTQCECVMVMYISYGYFFTSVSICLFVCVFMCIFVYSHYTCVYDSTKKLFQCNVRYEIYVYVCVFVCNCLYSYCTCVYMLCIMDKICHTLTVKVTVMDRDLKYSWTLEILTVTAMDSN